MTKWRASFYGSGLLEGLVPADGLKISGHTWHFIISRNDSLIAKQASFSAFRPPRGPQPNTGDAGPNRL